MVRTFALAGALLMYSASAVSCPNQEKYPKMEHLFVETDLDRTVDIRLGETVKIALAENATTGYRWAIDHYDEKFINLLATEPHYSNDTVGSGGEIHFIFEGKTSGTGEIFLKQWRSWEGDSSIIARFHIRLHVLP